MCIRDRANPLNAGGVIDLDSDYGGADLRWSWHGGLGARPFELTVGSNFDQFAQAWWQFTPRWSVLAGARHSRVQFTAKDRYVTPSNPDDSCLLYTSRCV